MHRDSWVFFPHFALSFYRCLAVWSGCHPHNFTATVLQYFRKYAPDVDPKTFTGVFLSELPTLEKVFGLNVNVYELIEDTDESDDDEEPISRIVTRVVQRSHRQYEETMNLNLFKTHFSYIQDMDQYYQSYACSKCGKLWHTVKKLHRHERTCDTNVKHKYVGGVYHLPETIFDKLDDEGIVVPEEDRYYPFRATYDFESYFTQDALPENSEKVTWEARHVPLSVAVCSNVPDFETPLCFVTEGDTMALIGKMMSHLEALAARAHALLRTKFQPIFQQLDQKITDAEEQEPTADEDKPHPLQKLREQLDAYLMEVPVCGFNSGKYDVPLCKTVLMSYLQERSGIDFIVKKNNSFMCLKTKTLKFVDIINYLAPGFSYAKYLKAFGCSAAKGFLPYEWITSLDKLNYPGLPAHEDFYSRLKGENISDEDYASCQRVFEEHGMKTFHDFLIWYNCMDVQPFLEAIQKQAHRHVEGWDQRARTDDEVPLPEYSTQHLLHAV